MIASVRRDRVDIVVGDTTINPERPAWITTGMDRSDRVAIGISVLVNLLDSHVSDTYVTPDTLVILEIVSLFDLNVPGTSETVDTPDTLETVSHLGSNLSDTSVTPDTPVTLVTLIHLSLLLSCALS